MPPQHVEIAETIAALKRALRREKEAPSDQPIYSATNRGNKLKRGANYVHSGALPYPHGPDGYKQKIEHAGFTRYILERNPRRYNEYGDELEDSESDTEADADADDENAYAGTRLEELLCPLKHPSELATHPSLSLPFLDPALPEMVLSTEEKLRQERANLWRAKNLNRQFIGDESWMPCANVENKEDWDLFEPKPRVAKDRAAKRKREIKASDPTENGVNGQDHTAAADQNADPPAIVEGEPEQKVADTDKSGILSSEEQPEALPNGDDVEMQDTETTTNGVYIKKDPQSTEGQDQSALSAPNGTETIPDTSIPQEEETATAVSQPSSTEATPPPPTRRITRALAAENNPSNAPTPPLSPTITPISTPSTSSLLSVDPLFLLTQMKLPNLPSRLSLPIDELLDTRRLLTMYIQKQEESVRGYEALLGKLIKAKRLRDNVLEWCKAEGHVGEWSDGEDWVDAEAWGVAIGELKKGKDEEEVAELEEKGGGKRRRRNRE